jgi:hypothetical protein
VTRRGGPYPYLRLDIAVKVEEGMRVSKLVRAGHSFREISAITGLSPTTAWRRYWWLQDWTLPHFWGKSSLTVPPQRGTRACPSGRPWIRAIDEGVWPKPG